MDEQRLLGSQTGSPVAVGGMKERSGKDCFNKITSNLTATIKILKDASLIAFCDFKATIAFEKTGVSERFDTS